MASTSTLISLRRSCLRHDAALFLTASHTPSPAWLAIERVATELEILEGKYDRKDRLGSAIAAYDALADWFGADREAALMLCAACRDLRPGVRLLSDPSAVDLARAFILSDACFTLDATLEQLFKEGCAGRAQWLTVPSEEPSLFPSDAYDSEQHLGVSPRDLTYRVLPDGESDDSPNWP